MYLETPEGQVYIVEGSTQTKLSEALDTLHRKIDGIDVQDQVDAALDDVSTALDTSLSSPASAAERLASGIEAKCSEVKHDPFASQVLVQVPSAGAAQIRMGTSPGDPNAPAAVVTAHHVKGDGLTASDSVSLSIATSPATVEGEPAVDHVFITGNGDVGIGAEEPAERLHVEGNILVTGDVLAESVMVGGKDVIQLIKSLQDKVEFLEGQLDKVNAELDLTQDKLHGSCQEAYDFVNATGQEPKSGEYSLIIDGKHYRVYCEMRSDGGWLRIGKENLNWRWKDEYTKSINVEVVTAEELDLVAMYGFTSFQASCDMDLRQAADDSSNQHKIFYHSISDLKTGSVNSRNTVMSYGSDHTSLVNRAGVCALGSIHPSYGPSGCIPGKVGNADCTAIMCHGSRQKLNTCGNEGKPAFQQHFRDVIYTRFEFRPRQGSAHGDQWSRNRFTLRGNRYFVYFK